jgi:proteasome lid subunit RPN8/RPN11
MMPRIYISGEIASRLRAEAQNEVREECCGLLAGPDNVITHILPATNVANPPSAAYEIVPEELFKLMRQIRAAGLQLLGIYHSHPGGDNLPSTRDIERAYYPDAAYFVLSPRLEASKPIRAFSIRNGRASELEIQIV